MGARNNPLDSDAALRRLEARVSRLESANPLQRGTVDESGQVRIAPGGRLQSDQGAEVELYAADIGFAEVLEQLHVEGPVFLDAGASITGVLIVNGGRAHLNLGLTVSGGTSYFNGNLVVGAAGAAAGDAQVIFRGVNEGSSSTGLRALAIQDNGVVVSVPFPTGGGGGDPGGGGDNPKGLIYPYPLAQAGDRYGPRDYAPSPYHYGIDWPKPHGTPIPACGDGTVILSENTGDLWGEFIRIDHGDGIWTGYAHMHTGGRYVSVGDTVTRGQIIGGVGTTGPSTGNHLHWEVYVDGSRVDPEWYVGPE